jgi:ubiquinone/menaquinone biosynthesis C-methylase UbiE
VIAFAGSVPENYDRYLRPILFEPYAADLAQRIGTGRILEIACGTGVLTRALLARKERTVVATDLNQGMIDVAKEKTQSDRVTWRQADAMQLPFGDGDFDTVCCQFGFMFVPDRLEAFRESRRVLRTGGSFVFSVWDSLAVNDATRILNTVVRSTFAEIPFSVHDRPAIEQAVRDAGFPSVTLTAVGKMMDASVARDFATGMIRGSPLFDELTRRGDDLARSIDAATEAIEKHSGWQRMQAIVVEAT